LGVGPEVTFGRELDMARVFVPQDVQAFLLGDLLEAGVPRGVVPASIDLQVGGPPLAMQGIGGPGDHIAGPGPALSEKGLLPLGSAVSLHQVHPVPVLSLHPGDDSVQALPKLRLQLLRVPIDGEILGRRLHISDLRNLPGLRYALGPMWGWGVQNRRVLDLGRWSLDRRDRRSVPGLGSLLRGGWPLEGSPLRATTGGCRGL
jgi:hypothetical protein